MGKRRHWVYAEANGCTVGLMRCCSCGKKITSGEFRYYETEEAYVCQCKKCGGSDKCWIEKDRQEAALVRKQWESDARTDHVVLLQRIKDAFFEGFAESDTGDFSVSEAWRYSDSKRVYDVLKELWSVQ